MKNLFVLLPLFVLLSGCARTTTVLTFDEHLPGTILNDQHRDRGVVFSSVGYDFVTRCTSRTFDGVVVASHWPSSGRRCVQPTRSGRYQDKPFPDFPAMQLRFVVPRTNIPAVTNFVSLRLDASPDDGNIDGISMIAFDVHGRPVAASTVDDRIPNALLSVSGPFIHRVVVVKNEGKSDDMETYDDLCFRRPRPAPFPPCRVPFGPCPKRERRSR